MTVFNHENTTAAAPSPARDGIAPGPRSPRGGRGSAAWLARNVGLGLAIAILLVVIAWALFPGVFTDANPLVGVGSDRLRPPSAEHILGTDQLGRDEYARIVYGSWRSLSGVVVAVAVALVVGSALGLLAGFVGRWADDVIMRFCDVMLAIPKILLSLAVITVFGGGTFKIALAVGIASIANVARTMRSEVLRVRTSDYVEAAKANGVRWFPILWRHVLPNSAGPVIVLSTVEFGIATLAIAGLSFLGYGTPPPAPEWGRMMADSRDYLATAWWLTASPGVVIVIIVLSVNQLARFAGIRKRGNR